MILDTFTAVQTMLKVLCVWVGVNEYVCELELDVIISIRIDIIIK